MVTVIAPLSKKALEMPVGVEKVPFSSFRELTFVDPLNQFRSITILMVEFKNENLFDIWKKIINNHSDSIIERQDDEAIDDGTYQDLLEISCILEENDATINADYGLIQVPINKLKCLNYLKSLDSFSNSSDYLLSLFNVSEIDQFIPNFRFDSEKIKKDEEINSEKIFISGDPQYISLINFELDKDGTIVSESRLGTDIKREISQNSKDGNEHPLIKTGKSNFFKILGYVIIGFGWFMFLWEVFLKHLSHVGYAIAMTLIVIAALGLMNNKK